MAKINKGIIYSTNKLYITYEIYNNNGSIYYLCIPNNNSTNYDMFIGLPKINYNNEPKDRIIKEIDHIAEIINKINRNNIYIIPNITPERLSEAAHDNDDKLYMNILKDIYISIKETYDMITKNNLVTIDMDQIIDIIVQDDNDKKFADWLEINLFGYINPIRVNELKKHIHTTTLTIQSNKVSPNKKITTPIPTPVGPIQSYGYSNILFLSIIAVITLIASLVAIIYYFIIK